MSDGLLFLSVIITTTTTTKTVCLALNYGFIVGGDTLLISAMVHFDHEVEALLLHAINHGKGLLTDWRRHCSGGNDVA